MAELGDARDLKSCGPLAYAGSTPAPGTSAFVPFVTGLQISPAPPEGDISRATRGGHFTCFQQTHIFLLTPGRIYSIYTPQWLQKARKGLLGKTHAIKRSEQRKGWDNPGSITGVLAGG